MTDHDGLNSTSPASELIALDRRMQELQRVQADARAVLAELPPWCVGQSFDGWRPTGTRPLGHPRREALFRAAARSGSSRLLALATLWVAVSAPSADELDEIAALLEARVPAGLFPAVAIGQATASNAVTWLPLSLGDVARAALAAALGRTFADHADYADWRRTNPDVAASLEYWEAMLVLDPGTAQRLRAARPELYVRVALLARADSVRDDPELVALVVRELGPPTVRALLHDRRWPELADPERFARFATWIFDHASSVLELGAAGELWRDRATLPLVVWPALARAAVLARRELPTSIEDAFHEPGEGRDAIRSAVLDAVAQLGHRGLPLVKRLLDQRFATDEPLVLEAAVRALESMGATFDDPSRSAMFAGAGKGSPPIPAERERAARARRDLLARVRAWLDARSADKELP